MNAIRAATGSDLLYHLDRRGERRLLSNRRPRARRRQIPLPNRRSARRVPAVPHGFAPCQGCRLCREGPGGPRKRRQTGATPRRVERPRDGRPHRRSRIPRARRRERPHPGGSPTGGRPEHLGPPQKGGGNPRSHRRQRTHPGGEAGGRRARPGEFPAAGGQCR